MAEVIQNIPL